MRALLDLVAPVRCLRCDLEADGELCASCAEGIRVVSRPRCDRCGSPGERGPVCPGCATLDGFVRARSLVVFAEPARSLTLALKRRGRGVLASDMGSLVGGLAYREGLAEASAVTFVPAGARADKRGFDPAELLARGVAATLGLPVQKLLVRVADGPRQADVGLDRRRTNVRGRFASRITSGAVLLVDDVYTTGATAEACSLALREAGAERVDVVTWARTLRRIHR